jgi:phosphotransferase system  glucose/maltose/N-acetylglucosamine-specific IIC component
MNAETWWQSFVRVIRLGLMGFFGTVFFIDGLARGGFPIFLITMLPGGDRWIHRHSFVVWAIAIAFALAVILPLGWLYSKEDDYKRRRRYKAARQAT